MAGHGLVSVLPCTGAEPSCCSSKSLFFPYILIPFQVTVFPVKFPQFTVYPSLNKLVSACCFIFHTLHIPSQCAFSQHLLTSQPLSQEPKPGLCSWAISKPALAHAQTHPGEEDRQQDPQSDSACGHTSASCYEVLKTGTFFSHECRRS